MYEGVPTKVCPHTTTGRADYWGPFINRAARFSNSAAHGGQIMVPAAVACKLVLCLTGQTLGLDGDAPLLVGPPDFVPTKLKLRPTVPSQGPLGTGSPLRRRRFEDARRSAEVTRCPAWSAWPQLPRPRPASGLCLRLRLQTHASWAWGGPGWSLLCARHYWGAACQLEAQAARARPLAADACLSLHVLTSAAVSAEVGLVLWAGEGMHSLRGPGTPALPCRRCACPQVFTPARPPRRSSAAGEGAAAMVAAAGSAVTAIRRR